MFKKFFSKRQGFTLVELMIVIVIIGVLTTLIIVSLDNTKMTARNARRLADIKQIQLALKMYYNDTGMFPTSIVPGSSISRGGANYMLRVPANPKPWPDNGCPDQDYQYKQLEGGQRYILSFCLGDTTDDLSKGTHIATANGILDCPSGYMPIPGSAALETNDFCVMKYEAKCAANADLTIGISTGPMITVNSTYNNSYSGGGVTGACTSANSRTVVSVKSGPPLTGISWTDAKAYCATLGGHLITNAEWMTIARNIEQVPSNWLNATIGSPNYLSLGHYGGITTAMVDGNLLYGSGCGGSCSNHIFLRNLTLSTGETIQDFSGNVAEWVDATCTPGTGIGNYQTGGTVVDWTNAGLTDYERGVSGPSNSTWDYNRAVGQYKGCTLSNNVFLRGGASTGGYDVGIFDLDLTKNQNVTGALWGGFRCVK